MTTYRIEVRITPRAGLLDPEGKAIHHALESLGYGQVRDVRVGRALHVEMEADDQEAARERAEEMCRKILANPVTEEYEIEVVERR